MQRKIQFIISKDKRGDYFCRCRFPNGRIYYATEGYKTKVSLLKSMGKERDLIQAGMYKVVDKTLVVEKGVKHG